MADAETIKAFVIAGHGNLEQVKTLLEADPNLRDQKHQWRENDFESAIQAASHVGNREIALYLLEQGAALELPTVAMLGDEVAVQQMLERDPGLIETRGAHNIPLLPHAALSGNVELVRMLFERGARDGASQALGLAVGRGWLAMAEWLVQHTDADINWKNMQGKTVLEIASERGDTAMLAVLQRR